MTDSIQLKKRANELRKTGQYDEAVILYRELWQGSNDEYVGAGLLHCLRKLKLEDEALLLAEKLLALQCELDWCRKEISWTLIQFKLKKLGEDADISKLIEIAEQVISLNPDPLAAKNAVFEVLKCAKVNERWDILVQWSGKLDPEVLNTKPMTDDQGRETWCDQALWYNYRIKGLKESNEFEETLTLATAAVDKFPKQRKFFERYRAFALYRLGKTAESLAAYKNLCAHPRCDWWLQHEYGKLLIDSGQKEFALSQLLASISKNRKLESAVNLIQDIGFLCSELGRLEMAKDYLILCKLIREDQSWSIPKQLEDKLSSLISEGGESDYTQSISLSRAYERCRKYWNNPQDSQRPSNKTSDRKQAILGLRGTLSISPEGRPYCFIKLGNGESYFCLIVDLPHGMQNGQSVIFDAIPSFDRKKNQESFRAKNVKQTP